MLSLQNVPCLCYGPIILSRSYWPNFLKSLTYLIPDISLNYLNFHMCHNRNQTTSAIRNHHISTKHPKAELKDFTIIDRDSNTLHHQAKEALHIHIKDPSLNRNIGKVRIPSIFNKLLKPPIQPELPHSSISHPRGAPSSLGLSTQKIINTSHLL